MTPSWRLRERLGLLPKLKGGAFLLLAADVAGLAAGAPILGRLAGLYPRMNVFVGLGDPALRQAAGASGLPPGATVLPLPMPGLGSIRRLVAKLKPNLVLVASPGPAPAAPAPALGRRAPGRAVSPALVDALARDGAAIVLLGSPPTAWLQRLARAPDLAVLQPGQALHSAREIPLLVQRPGGPLAPVLERLQPLVVLNRETVRQRGRRGAAAALMRLPWLGHWLGRRFTPVLSVDDLKQRLGRPRTLMCLGNGPSSEDPRLATLAYDALFRVNHSWRERGVLTRPDMVFTGSKQTIESLAELRLVGFHTIASEQDLLGRCRLLRHRFAYATAERLGTVDFAAWGIYAPTNGAVMLATAVRLAPARLVVGGMDLFSHPAGSYPGDDRTPNAYTVRHDREVEQRFILATLAAFQGELVIVGEVLQAAWQRHRQAGPPGVAPAAGLAEGSTAATATALAATHAGDG